jgi:hypothetical protein
LKGLFSNNPEFEIAEKVVSYMKDPNLNQWSYIMNNLTTTSNEDNNNKESSWKKSVKDTNQKIKRGSTRLFGRIMSFNTALFRRNVWMALPVLLLQCALVALLLFVLTAKTYFFGLITVFSMTYVIFFLYAVIAAAFIGGFQLITGQLSLRAWRKK